MLIQDRRRLRGCRVHRVNEVRFQNCLIFSGKWVSLQGGEISTVCDNHRNQNGWAAKVGHGEGMIGPSQNLATCCSRESSAA